MARLLDREELRQGRRDGECDEEEPVDRRDGRPDNRRRRGERKRGDPEQQDRCKRRQPVGAHRPPTKEETVVRSVDHGWPRPAWSAFPAYRRPWPFLPPPFAGAELGGASGRIGRLRACTSHA